MLSTQISLILILLIFLFIFLISNIYTKWDKESQKKDLFRNYMGFILIIFGLLKLYDLKKFAEIFNKYDLISKNLKIYAYIYPFLEIILGILMLYNIKIREVNLITFIIIISSLVSVTLSVLKGEQLRCGCLGSFFHVPLSYITISENIIMLLIMYNNSITNL